MINDGFCNICNIFKGHEDLKTLMGIFFCEECRELFTNRSKTELVEEFRKICGIKNE